MLPISRQLQNVSYQAITRLVTVKGELGILPASVVKTVLNTIGETTALLSEIERALDLDGELPASLRSTIGRHNRAILAHSSDQIVPLPRPFGNRWFDDFTVPESLIAQCSRQQEPRAPEKAQ